MRFGILIAVLLLPACGSAGPPQLGSTYYGNIEGGNSILRLGPGSSFSYDFVRGDLGWHFVDWEGTYEVVDSTLVLHGTHNLEKTWATVATYQILPDWLVPRTRNHTHFSETLRDDRNISYAPDEHEEVEK